MRERRLRGVTQRAVVRVGGERAGAGGEADDVAVEEPLEIRVAGDALAITMRTPGDDGALAVGFLFAEGVIASVDDVGTVAHCGRVGEEGFGNVIDVVPASGARVDPERLATSRRGTLTTAACGVCGRRSVDDLLARCTPQADSVVLDAAAIFAAFERLRAAQRAFARTGGLHAAGVFDARGEALAVYEDVGRHNAVDKAIGQRVLAGAGAPRGALLAVSGRASFEMVQKAVVARIPVVASVSAPSSLAVDLAVKSGTTLAGFVRDGRMNVYAHAERVRG